MNIKNKNNFTPDYAIHPGVTLSETLETLNMSQLELATRMGRPEKTISEIINGVAAITPETAIQLERTLGVSASFWNNLEKNYQEIKARLNAKYKLQSEVELLKKFPFNLMQKYGWIKNSFKNEERVQILLNFFGTDSLNYIGKIMSVNFRKHRRNGKTISEEAIYAWLRKGEIDSQVIQTNDFDEKGIRKLLPELVHLSTEAPQIFLPKIKEELAKVGVAFVLTRDLHNTYICGSSRWLGPKKAMIQLSNRGSFADILWFTLFHELGHILLHGKKERFVDIESSETNEIEIEADNFASDYILPKNLLNEFIDNNFVTIPSIIKFAAKIGIDPGIVVGRLQHEHKLKYNQLNSLRIRYKWQPSDR